MKSFKIFGFLFFASSLTSFANYDIFRTMDRPQLTEKPHTLGKGTIQIEGSAFNFGYEKDGPMWARSLVLLPTTGKYGLAEDVDLFLTLEPVRHFRVRGLPARTGLGDMRLGGEYTFWENTEFASALSVAPFVKFPTNTDNTGNNAVEFGVKAPFTLELQNEFTFGAMLELDVFEDMDGRGYHFQLVNAVSITRPIVDAAALYGEYFSRNSFEDNAEWISLLGLGGIYAINEQLLIDASFRFGLTEAANDIEVGAGAVFRF
jgi:hypothetical protein